MYIELHCASAFSFLQGASLPDTLIERAAALGYPALALLDADGVYGAPRFHKAARKAGLKAIIGAELTIAPFQYSAPIGRSRRSPVPSPQSPVSSPESRAQSSEPRGPNPESRAPSSTWQLPVLVESPEGYRNLCRLVTRMKMGVLAEGAFVSQASARAGKRDGALRLEDLEGWTTGLVALGGRRLLDGQYYGVGGLLDRLVGIFGRRNVCVELQRHLLRDDETENAALEALARAFRVPMIATNGVRFAEPRERPLFDVLTCVRHRTTLDAAGRRLARNAERYLKPPEAMARLFADRPEALTGTEALAERLEYTMADLGYRFPQYPVPGGDTEIAFLRQITEVGARERYRPYHDKARIQITRELDLIEKLNLAGYFLIVWEIVNYARQQDILVQGRGSAANSAVCYSLGITAVDPIAMDLLFERFLSEERGEWPDIDLDLPSGERRERVIQHVYEKYGRLGAAMTANVITYRGRSAARDVGMALSLDTQDIDRFATVMHHVESTDASDTFERHLRQAGVLSDGPRMRMFAELWQGIQDLPRHLGQHSGGMVVCQGTLDTVVPLEPASMPGRVVVQWDKDDCADMGIVKVDLLGLGMMAVLQDAIQLVNRAEGSGLGIRDAGLENAAQTIEPRVPFTLAHIPPDDPAVYDLLQRADTVGVFQVESRAQMATLPRLKPVCFYDLVVQVAIIRPGPIVGEMVHPYLNRRAGREPVIPLHPSLEPVLARTLGVPLFQEQLLRIAMVAAGFTGGQAEELRRAMGFKRSEKRMQQIEVELRAGMAQKGITGETADRIVGSITAFALYGFPESHAASFALLAYASAYLKVHYPAAFYTALLNNQPMGCYHPATLVKDAQRRGVRFLPIDVQRSDWVCRVEEDGAIGLGLMYVNGLRKEVGQTMAAFNSTRLSASPTLCPKCGSDDESMIELVRDGTGDSGLGTRDSGLGTGDSSLEPRIPSPGSRSPIPSQTYFCNTCAHEWTVVRPSARRFTSIEDMVRRTGIRRDELTTLSDVGALNAFTGDRRSALWQAERVVRPAGELFREPGLGEEGDRGLGARTPNAGSGVPDPEPRPSSPEPRAPSPQSPLRPMDAHERLRADYAGTGLTIGPHPMALRRGEMALRGVWRSVDLAQARDGRRVRVAGMVITRQRPGTAKGFVFLTLEDETGIANIIVRPDLFDRERTTVVRQPFLLVEGILQHQDGVRSIKAERFHSLDGGASVPAHDFC